MKSAARLAAILTLALALPALAQQDSDKARLDDFALPQDQAGPRIEQLGAAAQSLPAAESGESDRQLAIPGPPVVERAPVAQLSRAGETAPARLSRRGHFHPRKG